MHFTLDAPLKTKPAPVAGSDGLTPAQRAAHKAVATRRANETRVETARAEMSDSDARITEGVCPKYRGLLHVLGTGVVWSFATVTAAREYAKLRGFTVVR